MSKALFLDFDGTLTLDKNAIDDFDVKEAEGDFTVWMGDSERIATMNQFLQKFKDEWKVDLYILSANDSDIITQVLQGSGINPQWFTIQYRRTKEKYRFLNSQLRNYDLLVFVDDNPDSFENIDDSIHQVRIENPLQLSDWELLATILSVPIDKPKTNYETPLKRPSRGLFMTPDSTRLESCMICQTNDVPLFTCANCRAPIYCNRACQSKDWPRHRLQCSTEKNGY